MSPRALGWSVKPSVSSERNALVFLGIPELAGAYFLVPPTFRRAASQDLQSS